MATGQNDPLKRTVWTEGSVEGGPRRQKVGGWKGTTWTDIRDMLKETVVDIGSV